MTAFISRVICLPTGLCAIDGPANCRLVDEKPGCAATLFRVQPACCARRSRSAVNSRFASLLCP